jgi:predicted porin
MKKHLIAAAVAAAVAVPAMAQNVSISGTLDLNPLATDKYSIGTANVKRSSTTNAISASGGFATSVLNFSGTEDLGGGLKASFFVNQVIDNNLGTPTARDRFLSLAGGFGEFKVGRFATLADGYGNFAGGAGTTNTGGTSDSSVFDLVVGSLGNDPTLAATTVTAGSAAGGDMGRQSGIVQYSSPTMNGFKVALEYINNSADTDATANSTAAKQTTVAVTYAAGPLSANVTSAKRKVTTESTTTDPKADLMWFGVRYDLGMAVLFASHGIREDESASAKTSDLKVSSIGVQVPMGAATLFASTYDGSDDRNGVAANQRDLGGYQVGARYALSKRTYAYLVSGKNELEGPTAATTFKRNNASLGLVHTF